ncbi:MAG: hypothetical protein IIA59_09325 [Candidatus Marinimicrobia bacterium]|nr:hypothetical protein [Candidatus Neomarinimicrobiota bacterium]
MKWSDLKGAIGKAAPMLGTLLGGPAGAGVGSMIASVLGVENSPDEVHKALEADPGLLLKLREAEIQQQTDLQRMTLESETAMLTQVNETMRAELASGDKFKSYWRPLFGYVMALTWGATMFAVSYQLVWGKEGAEKIISSIGDLAWLWGIGLSVLGINVTKRSHDKAVAYDRHTPGIMSAIADRITGGTSR